MTDVLFMEHLTFTVFQSVADDIRLEIQAVADQAEVIESDTFYAVARVDEAESVLDPVFVVVDGIVDTARCGFVGNGYLDIHHVLCEDVMGVLARIVVAMMVVAVTSLIACCCTVKMVRKSYWLKQQNMAKKRRKSSQKELLGTLEFGENYGAVDPEDPVASMYQGDNGMI